MLLILNYQLNSTLFHQYGNSLYHSVFVVRIIPLFEAVAKKACKYIVGESLERAHKSFDFVCKIEAFLYYVVGKEQAQFFCYYIIKQVFRNSCVYDC